MGIEKPSVARDLIGWFKPGKDPFEAGNQFTCHPCVNSPERSFQMEDLPDGPPEHILARRGKAFERKSL
jgi:hypothetical protein